MERKYKNLEVVSTAMGTNVIINGGQTIQSARVFLVEFSVELQRVFNTIFKREGFQIIDILTNYIYCSCNPKQRGDLDDFINLMWMYYQDAYITLDNREATTGTKKPRKIIYANFNTRKHGN